MPEFSRRESWFTKVNFVIDAWSQPCNAPWYLYVETMKPAALRAFITLISFGWGDVVRGGLRPKALGLRRTGKRKPKPSPYRPRLPEIGNWLGKNIPGSDELRGKHYSNGYQNLWRVDNKIQAVLFWWLIADVTIDFLFEWTSLLYEQPVCQPQAGSFAYSRVGTSVFGANGWHNTAWSIFEYEDPFPSWQATFGNAGPNGCTVAAAATVEQRPGQPKPNSIQFRIVKKDTNEVVSLSRKTDFGSATSMAGLIKGAVPGNIQFQVQHFVGGSGFYNMTDGDIVGIETV